MFVKAVKCKECNTTVYSRVTEDVRECECGRIRVYGGFKAHFKYDVKDSKTNYQTIKVSIDATPDDLYDDYESMEDKFGLVKPEENNLSYIF